MDTAEGITIIDNFKFCEIHHNKAILSLPDSCTSETAKIEKHKSEYYIITKEINEVAGKGWFCSKQKNTVTTYKNFWGTREILSRDSNYVKLTKEDCEEMIRKEM